MLVKTDNLHEALLDNLYGAVFLSDLDLTILYANSAAESLFQMTRSKLCTLTIFDLLEDQIGFKKTLGELVDSGTPHTRRHEKINSKITGKSSKIDCSFTPIDVVETKRLLIEMHPIDHFLRINREHALLSAHDTSKSLVRGLAHEIKNPLGGIRGAAQLLDQEIVQHGMDEESRELTKIITTETDRLKDLVDRLLEPHHTLKFEKLNIHEVTEHVTSLLEAETHGNFQFTRDYDPSIPELNGDKSQLIQAVLNVSRNALQALHEADIQQPKITVRTRVQRNYTISDNRYRFVCRVDVIDNGPGITPDMTEQIFFPLVSERSGGTGLGLTIAQTAVTRHKGTIECSSEPGDTIFSIYLPLGE